MFALKLTPIGNALGVILPPELIAHFGGGIGTTIYVVETEKGLRMTSTSPLATMRDLWEALGIADRFHAVHQFSRPEFSGKHETLEGYVRWCETRTIRAENRRTLARALYVAEAVQAGTDFETAVTAAWQRFPLATR